MVDSYNCDCVPGYTGNNCSVNINECETACCLNGATCNDLTNEYFCSCVAGFIGSLCEMDIDECTSFPCDNGGIYEMASTCSPILVFLGIPENIVKMKQMNVSQIHARTMANVQTT
jgi:hypothetical protein